MEEVLRDIPEGLKVLDGAGKGVYMRGSCRCLYKEGFLFCVLYTGEDCIHLSTFKGSQFPEKFLRPGGVTSHNYSTGGPGGNLLQLTPITPGGIFYKSLQ